MTIFLNNPGEAESVKIFTLCDNHAGYGPYNSAFLAQHGLSILLNIVTKHGEKNILLDTGSAADTILHNMKLLSLQPENIDMIFLTHCHYDHAGGVTGLLKAIKKEVPVIAHPSIFRENYIFKPSLINAGIAEENGRQAIIDNGGRLVLIAEPFNLMDGVVSSGEVERTVDFEDSGIETYNVQDGKVVRDALMDDMALVINIKDKGLLVVTGCSHAGIINILRHAVKITGISRIYGVAGGFHLISATSERINRTLSYIQEMDIELVLGGHCTGLKALAKMTDEFGEKFRYLHSGLTYVL